MKHKWVYVRGSFLEAEKAGISPFNRGLLYGDGIFETMRGYGLNVFAFDDHMERMEKSAAFLKLNFPLDRRESKAAIKKLLKLNQLDGGGSRIRLTLVRGEGSGGLAADEKVSAEVIVSAESVPEGLDEVRRKGVRLTVVKGIRIDSASSLVHHKTLNYLPGVLGLMEVKERGADEGLLLNHAGNVTEGITSNLFIVRDGMIRTPPISAGILPGITRKVVIDLARKEGLPLEEVDVSPDALLTADEIFITSSVREVMPVVSVDEGHFEVGPLTVQLQGAYKDFIESLKN